MMTTRTLSLPFNHSGPNSGSAQSYMADMWIATGPWDRLKAIQPSLKRWFRSGTACRGSERGIEAHVIHPTSTPVKRDHRRAKIDRFDTKLLKRAFLGWLRGEPEHCTMAAIPTLAPDTGRGGQPAPEPRARDPGRRAHAHR